MIKNTDCLIGMKDIPSGSVDMILTDLPYGMTDCAFDKRLPFEPMWQEFWRVTKPNAAIVLFSVGKFTIELAYSQLKYYRYEWIWQKNLAVGFLNAKKMPLRSHENILVFYKKLPTYNPQFTKGKPYVRNNTVKMGGVYHFANTVKTEDRVGRRYPKSVVAIDFRHSLWGKPSAEYNLHCNQKPTDLLEYLIRTYTNEGETVLDATMGSGSTGVACVNTNRNFIGFEIDEGFYKIAEKRISEALAKKTQELF